MSKHRMLADATLTPEQIAQVLELVRTRGLQDAALELDLSVHSVERILSPLPVRQQTANKVANRLVAIASRKA